MKVISGLMTYLPWLIIVNGVAGLIATYFGTFSDHRCWYPIIANTAAAACRCFVMGAIGFFASAAFRVARDPFGQLSLGKSSMLNSRLFWIQFVILCTITAALLNGPFHYVFGQN